VSERWGRLAVGAALLFVALLQIHRLDDFDTWWHLAAGRHMVETGQVTRTDPFSYTAPGAPWLNRQWLFEIALYGSWVVAGLAGPILLAGSFVLAAWWALARLLRREMPDWAAAVVLALAAAAAVERFTVRPEPVSFFLLATYLLLLHGPVTRATVMTLVALQLVWANAHALSVLGVVVIALEVAGAAAGRLPWLPAGWRRASARSREEIRWLAAALVLTAACEFATPFGIEGGLYPLYLMRLIGGEQLLSHTIVEHRETTLAALVPPAATGLVCLIGLAVLAAAVSIRRWRLSHVLTAVSFVYLCAMARRNVALVGLGVAPLVAAGLGPALSRIPQGAWTGGIAAVVAALLSLQGVRVVRDTFYREAALTRSFGLGQSLVMCPSPAIAYLDRVAPGARVLNDDALGGLVSWESRPLRPVFFDGRLQVYPDAIYRQWQAVLDDPRHFPALAARWGIEAVVLHHPSRGRLELAAAIARLPDWRVAHLDAGGVVLLPGPDGRLPDGLDVPVMAAGAPGLAGWLDRALDWIRPDFEQATALYQRGRAIHFLLGPAGYPMAAADFAAALRLVPDHTAARIGLQATTTLPGR
jgi:hypothetical protein